MKTCWVLGAGASVEAGYPLVRDFLSHEYLANQAKRHQLVGLKKLPLRRFASEVDYFKTKGNGINDVMTRFLAEGNRDELARLNNFVYNQIALSRWFTSDFCLVPYMDCFATILAATDSSLITFNYDLLVEERLGWKEVIHRQVRDGILDYGNQGPTSVINYCAPGGELETATGVAGTYFDYGSGYIPEVISRTTGVRIVKPHGSAEWYYCSACLQTFYLPENQSHGRGLALRYASVRAFNCPTCSEPRSLQAFFVPPAADTRFPAERLVTHLWERAAIELATADVIVVAGYSFPAEDATAFQIFSDALAGKRARLVVVDAVASDALAARARSLVPDAVVLKSTFSEFLRGLMCRKIGVPDRTSSIVPDLSEIFNQIASIDSAREGGPLCGVVPWDDYLPNLVGARLPLSSAAQSAIGLMGFTGDRDVLDFLARDAGAGSPEFASLAVAAICSADNQAALAAIDSFIANTGTVCRRFAQSPIGTGIQEQPLATVAVDGIAGMILRKADLDYFDPIIEMFRILKTPGLHGQMLSVAVIRTFQLGIELGVFSESNTGWIQSVIDMKGALQECDRLA